MAAQFGEEIQPILDDAKDRMSDSVRHLRDEMNAIRAGRASPAMVKNVKVEYYGSMTPLEQVASITAPQADLLLIKPFDRNSIDDIERAIMKADLGLNPNNDGEKIRVPVPPLSEERRRELVDKARERAEETKISIRNIRRDAKDEIKSAVKEHNLSEDVRYGAEERLQEITDAHTDKVDEMMDSKEEAIMDV
jgi:ribosome recycling factor